MKFESDIDIDFGNRDAALKLLQHTPAGIIRDGKLIKHNTGIYVTDIPYDPFTGVSTIDHKVAEQRGYTKLDLLNVSLYTHIKNEQQLQQLMDQTPSWDKLRDREFCSQLIHIGNHYDTMIKMPEPVDSDVRMMMFLAIIRPAKRHLIGLPWKEVAKTIWEQPTDGSYGFKKAHACAYSRLVMVHMNLLSTDTFNSLYELE
jgi:hypothetical protein